MTDNIIEIKVPNTGMGIAEGEVLEWKVAVGDSVAVGDILVELETAKAVEEVLSTVNGVVVDILVPAGDSADVGADLVLIKEQG